MNYHKIRIRRYIILYILIFGMLGSMLVMLFSHFFSFSVIQKNYTEDYVQSTFEGFDSDMTLLVTKINMLIFNLSSNSSLLNAVYDAGSAGQTEEIQLLLTDILAGYDEIIQLDILADSVRRYTFFSEEHGLKSALSLPMDSFLASVTSQKLHFYDYTFLSADGEPVVVFGRDTPLGQILVYLSEASVRNLYVSHFLDDSVLFLSNGERIVSCSDPDFIGMKPELLLKAHSINSVSMESNIYSQAIEIPAIRNELVLTYILSNQDVMQTATRLSQILMLLLLMFVLLSIVLSLPVYKRLVRSLDQLRHNLDSFAVDSGRVFRSFGESELEELDRHFVEMAAKLRAMFVALEQEKESKRIAELKALQSQINPHFIYNSIDAIGWMAKLKRPYGDIEMLSYHLGMFFRLGLHRGDNIITLADELQHARSYLEIERFRFPNVFTVSEEIDPEVLHLRIIKIVLQPLVENAVSHGFSGIDYEGRILIRISRVSAPPGGEEAVLFEVTDNGRGFIPKAGELPRSSRTNGGYGLKNVNERLVLEYGGSASLRFESVPGSGTKVSFRIMRRLLEREG